ncbi:MAG: DegT/DnrJ/EryC1/StrS family aminotransferase [Actinomycetota bacterium]
MRTGERIDLPTADIPFARTEVSPEAKEAVGRVLTSGWLTTGPEVVEFEREFAEAVSAPDAVAVSSCTAAIELSLRALRLPPGSRVLASTMTFCGAVNAIVHAGLRPVLVDVDPETLMPNAATTAEAVSRAGGVDAMTVIHFAGHPAPVEEMADAARLPLDLVVEDAAHAFGTVRGGRPVGSASTATCFSFYATKNLPIGEGGMVTTARQEIAEFVRRARLHGMSRDAWRRYLPGSGWRYTVETPGLKANLTDIQAAIGRAQLPRFPEWQERRRHLVHRYDAGLKDVEGIAVPARPEEDSGEEVHAWHLYVIRVLPSFGIDRDTLMALLTERGIGCSVHFIPVHHMPYAVEMDGNGTGTDRFPSADAVFPQILSLPLYPSLLDSDVDRVCATIADVRLPAARPLPPPFPSQGGVA